MDDSGTTMESPLPPAILRGLGDRSYDKRKAAALEVTSLIKTLNEHAEKEKIVNVINLLAHEFSRSRNVHHRKGGLIGLAACAIGLGTDIDPYLNHLIPQVLDCFDDPESRVCYYACESLYNISKVARTNILRYFNQIFDGLCKLFAHVDVDVKNGANLLDRLIKDIVTETETFDIESFIPLLQKHIRRTKPYIRQLLVGWITVLDAVPDINMLDYLPDFLDGLFNMLSDGNREIKQAADNALADFLREIKEAEVVEFGPMVTILVNQCRSKEKSNRYTAIIWVTEFIGLGGTHLLLYYSGILGSIIHCISDPEPEIAAAAKIANVGLMTLVRATTEEPFELQRIIQILTVELLSEYVTTRVACLHWIYMLHEKDANEMNKYIGDLLPALLKTVSDTADEVVLINLQVLARISMDEVQFRRVLNSLVHLFMEDRPLLETRGALVIRKLCALLDSTSIYMALAKILNEKTDLEFASLMVQTLNLILLTAPELASLRRSLKQSFLQPYSPSNSTELVVGSGSKAVTTTTAVEKQQQQPQPSDRAAFNALFACWTHNAVATFSLCLLAQAYELSSLLILKFAEVDVTVGFLMQIDKLVQLLESPIFIQLRLHLLETDAQSHGFLLKSLYGLLMLLPQSQAYKTLSDRLVTVSSLHMHIGLTQRNNNNNGSSSVSNDINSYGSAVTSSNQQQQRQHDALLLQFEVTQEKHTEFRMSVLRQKSLLLSGGGGSNSPSSANNNLSSSTSFNSATIGLGLSGLGLGATTTALPTSTAATNTGANPTSTNNTSINTASAALF